MTKQRKVIAFIVAAVAVLFVVLFVLSSKPGGEQSREQPTQSETVGTDGRTGVRKSDGGSGNVTVAASWKEEGTTLRFDIAIDTHSVDLSGFDSMRQFALEDAGGTVTAPQTVIPEGEGHHRSYTVDFPKPTGEIRLVVRDLAGVARRELVWPE